MAFEESPGRRPGTELFLERRRECLGPLFEGAGAGLFGITSRVSRGTGGRDAVESEEFRESPTIDLAPVAAGSTGSESIGVADGVDFLAYAIDPAEAQRLVQGFRIGDAGASGLLAVEADPDLGVGMVVFFKPSSECGGRRKVNDLHDTERVAVVVSDSWVLAGVDAEEGGGIHHHV